MMRRAATTILSRGKFSSSSRALPVGYAQNGGAQRLFASSTKAPPSPLTTTGASPSAASASAKPRDKGQEAIEKSERLHAEVKEMIATQKARQIEELERPMGHGFLQFLKASKPEILNIFFAFVCVLLAYQIHGMRAGIRKLLAEQEEKDSEIDRLRGLLAIMSEKNAVVGEGGDDEEVDDTIDNSFSARLAQKCAGIVRQIFEASEKRVGYSWILGKKLASGDALELEKLTDELQPIILSEIQAIVGESAYTPEEIKERRVAALQVVEHNAEQRSINMLAGGDGSQQSGESSASIADAQMGELLGLLDDVSGEGDGNATSTKVRRTRYTI